MTRDNATAETVPRCPRCKSILYSERYVSAKGWSCYSHSCTNCYAAMEKYCDQTGADPLAVRSIIKDNGALRVDRMGR